MSRCRRRVTTSRRLVRTTMRRWSAPTASCIRASRRSAPGWPIIPSGLLKTPPAPSSSWSAPSRLSTPSKFSLSTPRRRRPLGCRGIEARRDVYRCRARCLQAGRESGGEKGGLARSRLLTQERPGRLALPGLCFSSASTTPFKGRPGTPCLTDYLRSPCAAVSFRVSDPLRFAFVDGLDVPDSRAHRC